MAGNTQASARGVDGFDPARYCAVHIDAIRLEAPFPIGSDDPHDLPNVERRRVCCAPVDADVRVVGVVHAQAIYAHAAERRDGSEDARVAESAVVRTDARAAESAVIRQDASATEFAVVRTEARAAESALFNH